MAITARKDEHLAVAAGSGVEHVSGTGLEQLRLRHRALPGRDLAQVDLGCALLGHDLAAPLVISAMTGGTEAALHVNEHLAHAAAEHQVAMVLGSGRAVLEDPSVLRTFVPRERPPLLLANLGAVQLTAGRAARLVDLVGADGLSVHLNPLQEAVQPEGQPDFADALERIASVVRALAPLPVVVKEVGFGLDPEDVRALVAVGVAAVDVAGAGGTNWATIEGRRDARAGEVAAAFADWGVPTARAVVGAVVAAGPVPVIASGGLRDGVDVAKCLALGARAGGLARPMLLAAQAGRASEVVATAIEQLRIAIWACGAPSAAAITCEALQ